MSSEQRQPDPLKATQIAVVGKKGQGKTELAWLLFDSYPFDKVAIDPNGDLKVPEGTIELDSDELPSRWPVAREWTGQEKKHAPQCLRYKPDFGSPSYRDDIDRVIGLAYGHRRTACFVDEAHEAFPSGQVRPHGRRALRQGRHHDLTLIMATPRPITVDPLVLANADWVYVFALPNPNDRRRVAETIGWDPRSFDEAVAELGPFEYLRYDSGIDDLAHFPALPKDLIVGHKR